MVNPLNRRVSTATAGPDFTPIEMLNADLALSIKDQSAIDLSAAGKIVTFVSPEVADPTATVAAVGVVLQAGGAASSFRCGAYNAAMLAQYAGDVGAMLAARARLRPVPAGDWFDDSFAVPAGYSFSIVVVSGAFPAGEVHWMFGV